jgi:hypothetical protein
MGWRLASSLRASKNGSPPRTRGRDARRHAGRYAGKVTGVNRRMVGGLTGGWSRMGEVAHIGLLSALGFQGTSSPKTTFILCSSGVVLSLRERKYPKRSLRDRKRRGGLCNAGAGHRDFDSPGQISGKSIEITKPVCTPLAMRIAIAQCSVSLQLGTASSSFLASQLSPSLPLLC